MILEKDRLKSPDTFKPENQIGLFITGDETQLHTGFFIRTIQNELKQLHLATHNNLLLEPIKSDSYWVHPSIDEDAVMPFRVLLENIYNQNGRHIPYGFSFPDDVYNINDEIKKEIIGLTCASFVLSVFLRAEITLLKKEEWDNTEEDNQWFEKIYALFGNHPHASKLRDIIDSKPIRFRPEQVAGAGLYNPSLDIGIEKANESAEIIKDTIFS